MKIDFDLYLITDINHTCGRPLEEIVISSIKGGIKAVQLREKGLDDRELLSLANDLKALTSNSGIKLFINDRLDIAITVDAEGLHLGQRSISPKVARRYLGEKRLIGVSTHSLDEALKAQAEGADFVTIGPVYDTPSKRSYGMPVGLKVLEEVTKRLSIPAFAIGGINKEKVGKMIKAGAYGIAVISAIHKAKDPEGATMALMEEIRQWKSRRIEVRG